MQQKGPPWVPWGRGRKQSYTKANTKAPRRTEGFAPRGRAVSSPEKKKIVITAVVFEVVVVVVVVVVGHPLGPAVLLWKRTPKLTLFEPVQYWGGGPPGKICKIRKGRLRGSNSVGRDMICFVGKPGPKPFVLFRNFVIGARTATQNRF